VRGGGALEVSPPGWGMVQHGNLRSAHQARLLRLGEITSVRIPDPDIEAVRDLVRAHEDARADLMRLGIGYPNCCCVKAVSITKSLL
jgi:hypothetical protein